MELPNIKWIISVMFLSTTNSAPLSVDMFVRSYILIRQHTQQANDTRILEVYLVSGAQYALKYSP